MIILLGNVLTLQVYPLVIGNGAFKNCEGLVSFSIPSGVISIGNEAFEYCTSLKEIELPDSLLNIGEYAFCNSPKLDNVKLPERNKTLKGRHHEKQISKNIYFIHYTAIFYSDDDRGGCINCQGNVNNPVVVCLR